MRKVYFVLLVSGVVIFQYCSSSRKASKPVPVTYERNIQSIVATSCSPCHIPGKGNKKPLNSFAAASTNIDEILSRIQKNPGDKGFMPAMHPKLPDSTINLFIKWKSDGLREK